MEQINNLKVALGQRDKLNTTTGFRRFITQFLNSEEVNVEG
jgi:hypothetical protein